MSNSPHKNTTQYFTTCKIGRFEDQVENAFKCKKKVKHNSNSLFDDTSPMNDQKVTNIKEEEINTKDDKIKEEGFCIRQCQCVIF